MPPKSNLTREKIAETAFEILRKDGYDALNARYLAERLGTSTMPLFHYFENMDEIKRVAVRLGIQKYDTYMEEGSKNELPFKGIGRAYIKFAKEEPELFKLLFMTATENVIGLPKEDKNTCIAIGFATAMLNGNAEDGSRALRNMWIVVHGIATLEATGKMSFSDDEISCILSDIFQALKTNMIKEDER